LEEMRRIRMGQTVERRGAEIRAVGAVTGFPANWLGRMPDNVLLRANQALAARNQPLAAMFRQDPQQEFVHTAAGQIVDLLGRIERKFFPTFQ
jgi:hypothetical protein